MISLKSVCCTTVLSEAWGCLGFCPQVSCIFELLTVTMSDKYAITSLYK